MIKITHFRSPENVSKWVYYMNRVLGLPLAHIAEKPYFYGIPVGSIGAIANGYIPEKWQRQLGVNNPPRARASVNLENMTSTFHTLRSKITVDQMQDLTDLFLMHLIKQETKKHPISK